MINKKDIARLSKVEDALCVSIFIPTHRAGEAVRKNADAILLKNQWKEVTEKLRKEGLTPSEIEQLGQPILELIDNTEFWSHQSDGLALFLTKNRLEKFTLPIAFEAFHYVSNEFYLKPMMPMFVGDGRFFILTLSLNDVQFFEGTRHSITPVKIEDLTPARLEEVVGYDYKQKNLQFRTQQGSMGQGAFHGQGEGKEERKNEILRFFRAVDKGLMTMLHDEHAPMVVACQDHLFPIFKEANDYKFLVDKNISLNPNDVSLVYLHEVAWEKVKPHFEQERKEKIERFQEVHGTGQTAIDTNEVLQASLTGKTDTLFLENRADIWGVYNPNNNTVRIEEAHHSANVSLMNLAAIQVFLQGGKVYLMEKEEMPDDTSKMNALFRY
jgi:hypothetical protein